MLLEELPSKTTQITPERTSKKSPERTTEEPYDKDNGTKRDESSKNWKIGLSIGVVLFVIFIVIGKYVRGQLAGEQY